MKHSNFMELKSGQMLRVRWGAIQVAVEVVQLNPDEDTLDVLLIREYPFYVDLYREPATIRREQIIGIAR